MSKATVAIDPRSKRPTLTFRIEDALADEILDRTGPGTDVTMFSLDGEREVQGEGGHWWHVRASKDIENPPNSGIWEIGCQITARGAEPEEIERIEVMLATSEILSCLIADLAAVHGSGFNVPRGECAMAGAKQETGTDDDLQVTFNFMVIAQSAEIEAAA